MNEWRVIKKYPNRRLYDTTESRYVTLADIRRLVLAQLPFKVIDKATQRDITRGILLQVIGEQEQQGDSLLTREFLSALIRGLAEASAGRRPALAEAAQLLVQLEAVAAGTEGSSPIGTAA
ncbi:MAG: hypothetical protein RL026_2679 [Pseudomonadota bacterium]|jgi:polyhydroxyalkanoate synthesis repressor PhaR